MLFPSEYIVHERTRWIGEQAEKRNMHMERESGANPLGQTGFILISKRKHEATDFKVNVLECEWVAGDIS